MAAASLALQNSFGMVCDPIANRVEAPCLGKNVMAATNALSCTNMALAGYNPLIPFDEVVIAMNKVAHQIPRELRCTNLGGLSITPTAHKIAEKLARQNRLWMWSQSEAAKLTASQATPRHRWAPPFR